MKVSFNDSEYRRSHGKAPRGRGLWWFFYKEEAFQIYGTLTEAKAIVKNEIKWKYPEDDFVTVKIGA